MLDWLYGFLGSMLSWFSSLFVNKYVFGLLLYALVMKLIFLPFSIKQQKNQIKMAQLTPKIELIKAKYRGRTDTPTMQKMQQEIMELQQQEGYSPLSGCLPLLIQMPIIIFLYNVIRNPLSYICKLDDGEIINIAKEIWGGSSYEFKGIDQIKLVGDIISSGSSYANLENLPDFELFGLNLAATPGFEGERAWLIIIPVLAAAFTWLSMFLSRRWNNTNNSVASDDPQVQATNKSMQMMDIMMPAMTLFMAFGFSGMLGIYWIYQSVLGILQSFILSKAMPLPKYTEEELKAMKKAQKQAEKAHRQALKDQPKYRSLHYIDEDDYEALPEVKQNEKTKKPNNKFDDLG